ncbi:hypothetical protein [Dokdonia sp.]|uniref:hypothetical protein n=1 Tax=Dokdonia sp. TaxID=2024995 RepID=UPI0032647B36
MKGLDQIWLGIIEIKPKNLNTVLEDSLGAFVNVAYKAYSKDHFLSKVKDTFFENDFEVLDVDDIGTIYNTAIDNETEAEKLELINDIINQGYDFSWGIFHTYSDEEE